ncbi:UNVERIFIED_CONTAM: hypothetical protein Slati_1402000 [Sesamum latifolium]|uniref:Reverse transcriptase/retrotransposon-derived protein RNase H-like domain-containing protein n=1 Tax=Sesamum latifolium TaxID=2727402 RepID=A0AAW2X6A3_9LAMI
MQFEKGCKRSKPSYLCTLRFDEIEEASGTIPGVVKRLLKEFEDVMLDELPWKLPPKRAVDHEIELVPGTKPPARALYRMSQPELVDLRKQLKDILESGIIKPAKSRPMERRSCFRRRPTVPFVCAVTIGSESRRAMRQRRQWSLGMELLSFLSCLFWPDKCSRNLQHLDEPSTPRVLTRLHKHELYAKVSKCSFAQETISFLGHITERVRIQMDPKKLQAIEEWKPLSDVHDLRSSLSWANYYRPFDNLKRATVKNPMLALPDMSKPFVVETDASDFTLGGVLMQNGYPVSFESRKLKDVERRYSVHEKELLAVVHCLRLWRHYLLRSP